MGMMIENYLPYQVFFFLPEFYWLNSKYVFKNKLFWYAEDIYLIQFKRARN